MLQNVDVDRVQGADSVDVDGALLAVSADATDCLGHCRIVLVLVIAEQGGKEDDVVCGLDVRASCGFAGGVQDENGVVVAVLAEPCDLLAGGVGVRDDGGGDAGFSQICSGLLKLLAVLDEKYYLLALPSDVADKANGGIKFGAVTTGVAGFLKDVGPEQMMITLRSAASRSLAKGDVLLL